MLKPSTKLDINAERSDQTLVLYPPELRKAYGIPAAGAGSTDWQWYNRDKAQSLVNAERQMQWNLKLRYTR